MRCRCFGLWPHLSFQLVLALAGLLLALRLLTALDVVVGHRSVLGMADMNCVVICVCLVLSCRARAVCPPPRCSIKAHKPQHSEQQHSGSRQHGLRSSSNIRAHAPAAHCRTATAAAGRQARQQCWPSSSYNPAAHGQLLDVQGEAQPAVKALPSVQVCVSFCHSVSQFCGCSQAVPCSLKVAL